MPNQSYAFLTTACVYHIAWMVGNNWLRALFQRAAGAEDTYKMSRGCRLKCSASNSLSGVLAFSQKILGWVKFPRITYIWRESAVSGFNQPDRAKASAMESF